MKGSVLRRVWQSYCGSRPELQNRWSRRWSETIHKTMHKNNARKICCQLRICDCEKKMATIFSAGRIIFWDAREILQSPCEPADNHQTVLISYGWLFQWIVFILPYYYESHLVCSDWFDVRQPLGVALWECSLQQLSEQGRVSSMRCRVTSVSFWSNLWPWFLVHVEVVGMSSDASHLKVRHLPRSSSSLLPILARRFSM